MITAVHVFHELPEKFASAFMKFARTELADYRHEFIGMRASANTSHPSPEQVAIAPRGWFARYRFFRAKLSHAESTVWIFHGLFFGSETLCMWRALFAQGDLAFRAVWVAWGGDLYEFQRPAHTPVAKIRRMLYRNLAQRFLYIAGLTPGDLDIAHIRFNPRAIKMSCLYINPLPFSGEEEPPVPVRTTILLGNSADPTNDHLLGLDMLAAIDNGFYIVCPLSYSGTRSYIQTVIAKGTRLFGDRFRPLTSLLPATDYAAVIANVTHGVFLHNRQQALGNVLSLLYDGKHVFMREDTTGYRALADLGLAVSPLHMITADAFAKPITTVELDALSLQRKLVRDNFGPEQATKVWMRLINRVASQAPKYG